MISPQIRKRKLRKLPLLMPIDGLGRAAGMMRDARFHLDENHGSALDRHDVQLAAENTVTAMEDFVPLPLEEPRRRALAALAESLLSNEARFESN
jgi:hypothetical protein